MRNRKHISSMGTNLKELKNLNENAFSPSVGWQREKEKIKQQLQVSHQILLETLLKWKQTKECGALMKVL